MTILILMTEIQNDQITLENSYKISSKCKYAITIKSSNCTLENSAQRNITYVTQNLGCSHFIHNNSFIHHIIHKIWIATYWKYQIALNMNLETTCE